MRIKLPPAIYEVNFNISPGLVNKIIPNNKNKIELNNELSLE